MDYHSVKIDPKYGYREFEIVYEVIEDRRANQGSVAAELGYAYLSTSKYTKGEAIQHLADKMIEVRKKLISTIKKDISAIERAVLKEQS